MRTKNLNLKKKIAFIASVAMIATTAAYLPNEVTQNIFTSSITVEAASPQTINTAFGNIYIKNGEGKYLKSDKSGWQDSESGALDLADTDYAASGNNALDTAKVNGIVLPYGTTDVSIEATPVSGWTLATTAKAEATVKNGILSFDSSDKLTATGSSETKELSFAGVKLAVSSESATIASAHAYVKVNNKYLAYNSSEKKLVYVNRVDSVPTGTELIDLTLATGAAVDSSNKNTWVVGNTTGDGETTTVKFTSKGFASFTDSFVVDETSDAIPLPASTSADAEVQIEVVPVEGAVTSSASTVATTVDEHGLAKVAEKSETITVTGDNVKKNSKGVVTEGNIETLDFSGLKFAVKNPDKNGLGDIAVVPVTTGKVQYAGKANFAIVPTSVNDSDETKSTYALTKSGTALAANYVAQLNNEVDPGTKVTVDLGLKTNWTATGTGVSNGKITLTMGNDGKVTSSLIKVSKSGEDTEYYILTLKNGDSGINTTAEQDITFEGVAGISSFGASLDSTTSKSATDRYKVTKESKAMSVNGNTKFVDVFTVATNDTATTVTGLKFKATTGTINFATETNSLTTDTEYSDTIKYVNTGAQFVVTPGTGVGANYTTPVMSYSASGNLKGYFQIVFTNEYEVKLDDNNSETKNDGKAAVKGVTITRPDDAEKAGNTFKTWSIANDDTESKVVFYAGRANQQIKDETITPNITLYARYTANKYTAEYDANGGVFTARSGFVSVATNDDGYDTVVEKQYTADTDDTTAIDISTVAKAGYTFKGWAASADATEALTFKEFKELRPTEADGTVKLYAVWEANEITVNYGMIALNSRGLALSGSANADFSDATDTTAKYTAFADGTTDLTTTPEYITGKAYGTLPTPKLKGYTFDGWYRKVVTTTSGTPTYSAAKVTESTVIDSKTLDDETSITLYAKFKQNTYNVTVDYDGGQLVATDKDDAVEIASFKINQSNDTVTSTKNNGLHFYDADGTDITTNVTTAKGYAAKLGNGFRTFKGWSVNGSKSAVSTDAMKTTIEGLTTLADVTLKAVYGDASETNGSLFLNVNEGNFYKVTGTFSAPTKLEIPATKYTGETAPAGTYVADVLTVDGANVTANTDNYVVARPGYTFTGWFADEACTEKFDFKNAQFEKGVETTVYAGWKANTATRYILAYNLLGADGSFVTSSDLAKLDDSIQAKHAEFTYGKTFMGTTGTEINAADKEIVVDGKTYVFNSKLSAGYNTKDEIGAEYLDVTADPTNKVAAAGLSAGKFVVDPASYTVIEGVYVLEGSEPKELGKATNVKGTANGKKVTISFTAADNAVEYQICKIVNGKKYYTNKEDKLAFDISPATTDYQVYVIAFDKDGKSTHSETIKLAGVPKSTLGTVKNPKVTESIDASGNKIGTVTWDKVEGATWYKVFKVVNGKTYWGSKVQTNEYVFKNLPKDSSYIIYVAAGDDKGNVTYGARTKISKYPAVQNVKISADKKTVTFDKAEGAVNYQVAKLINGKTYYGTKSESNSITMQSAAKSGTQIFVLAFFTGDDGKTYSSYSQSITVE